MEATSGGREPATPVVTGFCWTVCPSVGVGVATGAGTVVVITKLGNADGGCTLDSRFPPALGTLAKETPGDGKSDVEDDILLSDSENSIY